MEPRVTSGGGALLVHALSVGGVSPALIAIVRSASVDALAFIVLARFVDSGTRLHLARLQRHRRSGDYEKVHHDPELASAFHASLRV